MNYIDQRKDDKKTIVFTSTKATAERLELMLADFGVAAIHGGKRPEQRRRVIRDFREGRVNALIARGS